MGAKKKKPARKKARASKKAPAKRNLPPEKRAQAKKTTRPRKTQVRKMPPQARGSSGAKGARRPVKQKTEFDVYVTRLARCRSVEDLRRCSERVRRGDPFAWEKTFDVILFGMSFKDEAGESIRTAVRDWAERLMLDGAMTQEQYDQIRGRLGLILPEPVAP